MALSPKLRSSYPRNRRGGEHTLCFSVSDLIKQILCGGVEEVQRGVNGASRTCGSLQAKQSRETKACAQEERRQTVLGSSLLTQTPARDGGLLQPK